MFKKVIYSLVAVSMLVSTTSCNDWLDVKPNNEQITDEFWQSKEDVESVVLNGYYYMTQAVRTLIKWGELRGGSFYVNSGSDQRMQDFNILPSNGLCNYASIYTVIGTANSVIKYAPKVRSIDDTYHEAMMNAHLCEAYFMRAYCNLILVKNFKEVPLILEPYVDDNAPFDVAKSSEEDIVKSIKDDVMTALNTGAAKGRYGDDTWENQGRVTKWALYALMADVCLWSEDYDMCKVYCDMILNATDGFRPTLLKETSKWFEIFNPGNSNEGIFELCYSYALNQRGNNFQDLWTIGTSSTLKMTDDLKQSLSTELEELYLKDPLASGRVGRMQYASIYADAGLLAYLSTEPAIYLWKYIGSTDVEVQRPSSNTDANFIIYRVADIVLMKALAETMTGNYPEAFALLNTIRTRAGLGNFQGLDDNDTDNLDEATLLEGILTERRHEFLGEAKRWYDILWYGRIAGGKYKSDFINMVVDGNQTTNASWVRAVLMDPNSWYLPLPQSDIEHNKLLIQNPYYSSK